GLSMSLTYAMGMRDGFTFSAGAIDYALNFGKATNPLGLALFGVVYFFVYFVVFYFMIKTFNLKTPGREDEDILTAPIGIDLGINEETSKYVDALGGIDNIKSIDSCITRLRLTVGDSSNISDAQIKALGAKGVIRPSKDSIQIVLGQKAEKIADELRKLK
nr:PTS transporter subunit EIIB [Sebaldella sp.]